MESLVPPFKHNDIVWAKVTGHPWWPGIVDEEKTIKNPQLYWVDFFGYPPSHSRLPPSKLIRYEDYHKLASTEASGRTCPGLKKAISQASILFNTLQQSKASPINKALTQTCLFETENTVVTSACKGEQKISFDDKIINHHLSFHNSFSQDNHSGPKKNRKIRKHVLKQKPKRVRTQIHHDEVVNQEVQQLLKKYKLDNIPDAPKQNAVQKDTNTAKFLYKIYRKNHSRQQSIEYALNMKGNIGKKAEIEKIIEDQRKLQTQKQQNNQKMNDF